MPLRGSPILAEFARFALGLRQIAGHEGAARLLRRPLTDLAPGGGDECRSTRLGLVGTGFAARPPGFAAAGGGDECRRDTAPYLVSSGRVSGAAERNGDEARAPLGLHPHQHAALAVGAGIAQRLADFGRRGDRLARHFEDHVAGLEAASAAGPFGSTSVTTTPSLPDQRRRGGRKRQAERRLIAARSSRGARRAAALRLALRSAIRRASGSRSSRCPCAGRRA